MCTFLKDDAPPQLFVAVKMSQHDWAYMDSRVFNKDSLAQQWKTEEEAKSTKDAPFYIEVFQKFLITKKEDII